VYHYESSSILRKNIGEPKNILNFLIVLKAYAYSAVNSADPTNTNRFIYFVDGKKDAIGFYGSSAQGQIYGIYKILENFIEAMIAAEGSYFGCWSIPNAGGWVNRD